MVPPWYDPTNPTAMDLIVEPQDGFLLANLSGEVSFPEAAQACRDICDFAAGLGQRKILLDCLSLKGDLSPDERFELAKNLAEYSRRTLTIFTVALIGKPPSVTGLGARVATNRGIPVEMFSDRERGLEWLRSRP